MINYNPKIWFTQIFKFPKSDTLRILWKEMVLLGVITAVLTYLEMRYMGDLHWLKDAIAVYSLVGFVLSLLLVFRTNTAYDRWWEGRKKWGEMVNNTRNLALKISAVPGLKEDAVFFRKNITNYAFALKGHLRSGVNAEELDVSEDVDNALDRAVHVPNAIAKQLFIRLQACKKDEKITEFDFITFNDTLSNFTDITGACERIRNTPMPYSYSLFLKKFIFIYVTTLPLAFVSSFGYGTVLIAVFIFYVLVSMEILAEEIEDPFGTDDNDLPIDELCEKIKANVTEILG
ncbi:MAG: putative membrane protein [Bacteroidia bacterium]|jgi:putative membrane protein